MGLFMLLKLIWREVFIVDKGTILKQYFGHEFFRKGQEEMIDHILAGSDVVGIMPTGGGKSLCYQVPALMLPGVTLVVSPLISLMKDQVMALKNAGVVAAFINSSLSESQIRTVYSRLRSGQYKIIYVAPERLGGSQFTAMMQEQSISLIAVDEAHCVSQWGQDFRPSYLKVSEFISKLPKPPVVAAFTATATEEVRKDIVRLLQLDEPFSIVTGFDRPNLFFNVSEPKNKYSAINAFVKKRMQKSGIIYCATRAAVEKVCAGLNSEGIAATRYHAGLSDEERRDNQEDFQYDRRPVMVATNAFGMGIDKSNVSYVVHYNMPKSIEAYYQEAGRAGRDGEAAECMLFYAPGDIATAKLMIQNNSGNEELSEDERRQILAQDYERLEKMTGYCRTANCLRRYILDYFGQESETDCGHCSNCQSSYTAMDVTMQAQVILSCVKRMKDHLGYSVGASLLVCVLCGSRERRTRELGLDKLSTYGLMKQMPREQLRGLVEFLEFSGYLYSKPPYSTIELTRKSSEVLFGDEKVEMPVRVTRGTDKEKRADKLAEQTGKTTELMDALKAVRNQIAQEEGVPAYIVFSNAHLADMAERRPQDMQEFLLVKGVGELKAARYGERFLGAIAGFGENGL